MKKEKPKIIKKVTNELSKHSFEILIVAGISGMIATTVSAVTVTPKAIKLIEEAKKEKNVDKLKPTEIVCETWKCYVPTVIMGITSISCIIGASSVHKKRNAALIAAYTLSESTLKEYRDKVIETVGEKKEKQVHDEIAKEKLKRNPVKNNEVIITNNGDTLCYDPLSGRYFRSNIEKIKQAEIKINRTMIDDMSASLNDFYYEIGLEGTLMGDQLGWTVENMMDINFSSQLASDGTPCLVIEHLIPPKYDYF